MKNERPKIVIVNEGSNFKYLDTVMISLSVMIFILFLKAIFKY